MAEEEQDNVAIALKLAHQTGHDNRFTGSWDTSQPNIANIIGVVPSAILLGGQNPLSCAADMGIEMFLKLAGSGNEVGGRKPCFDLGDDFRFLSCWSLFERSAVHVSRHRAGERGAGVIPECVTSTYSSRSLSLPSSMICGFQLMGWNGMRSWMAMGNGQ